MPTSKPDKDEERSKRLVERFERIEAGLASVHGAKKAECARVLAEIMLTEQGIGYELLAVQKGVPVKESMEMVHTYLVGIGGQVCDLAGHDPKEIMRLVQSFREAMWDVVTQGG